tara:strand:+ start:169 stop:483 length:315 start_codon:yes stop_codon:yes gene_type:complete
MNKKILEKCNRSELKELGLFTQIGLAHYLGVCYRTTNRRVSKNDEFCSPIIVNGTRWYHPKLIDKYCQENPVTKKQKVKIEQENKAERMNEAKNFLHEILKGEN